MKIYLTGITQNKFPALRELIEPVYKHFDGLIFVDGGSKDNTIEYLESRKKNGKIIQFPYGRRNDDSMNRFLFSGIMEDGDFFAMRDSEECLNSDFTANKMRSWLTEANNCGVDCIYQGSKPLFARYSENLFFHGNPHWGLQGVKNAIRIDAGKEVAWCNRPKWRGDMETYVVWHEMFYCLYPATNQLKMIYDGNPKKLQEQECVRREFISYCNHNGIPCYDKDKFIEFLRNSPPQNLLDVMKKEEMFWNVYRHYVLGHDPHVIRAETAEKRRIYGYNG